MPKRRLAIVAALALVLFALGSLTVALSVGSIPIGPADALAAAFGHGAGMSGDVVRQLRLPRALEALACGGLLALAGSLMQVLLRNPLADPYVLGISGGAGVGALSGILLGCSLIYVHCLAFAGASGAMFLVFGLARGDGSWTQTRLLLTGVMIAAACGALISLTLSIAPAEKLHGMLFWLMGDLSGAADPVPALMVLALALAAVLPLARELNLLARGGDSALALGVTVPRLRIAAFLIASITTATAVADAGSIGFVGLVVPHLVRMLLGGDQRLLIPAATLAGGSLLLLADTLARTVVAPQQLPVGVLTALIGVPVFLFLLARHPR